MQSTMRNDFFSSRPVIGVPVDAGDDAVVDTKSATTLRFGTWTVLVIADLAEGLIILFVAFGINGLIGAMIDVDMLDELGVVVVAVAAIALGDVETVSCVAEMRVGVWTGTVIGIDMAVATRVELVVRVLIDLLADIRIAIVTDIGVDVLDGVDENMLAAATTDLEVIDTRVSLENSLRFC